MRENSNTDLHDLFCASGWRCASKFPDINKAKEMCTASAATQLESIIGGVPCRSLFSEYTISLPKNDLHHESVTLNNKNLNVSRNNDI